VERAAAAGLLPAAFAVAMGVLVAAVQRGDSLLAPLAIVGVVFVLLQVLTPIHQAISANLGSRVAAWLYDRLTEAWVRPPGILHLEDFGRGECRCVPVGDLVPERQLDGGDDQWVVRRHGGEDAVLLQQGHRQLGRHGLSDLPRHGDVELLEHLGR
jgi:hypothetical protein